jgi:hypothetical protein
MRAGVKKKRRTPGKAYTNPNPFLHEWKEEDTKGLWTLGHMPGVEQRTVKQPRYVQEVAIDAPTNFGQYADLCSHMIHACHKVESTDLFPASVGGKLLCLDVIDLGYMELAVVHTVLVHVRKIKHAWDKEKQQLKVTTAASSQRIRNPVIVAMKLKDKSVVSTRLFSNKNGQERGTFRVVGYVTDKQLAWDAVKKGKECLQGMIDTMAEKFEKNNVPATALLTHQGDSIKARLKQSGIFTTKANEVSAALRRGSSTQLVERRLRASPRTVEGMVESVLVEQLTRVEDKLDKFITESSSKQAETDSKLATLLTFGERVEEKMEELCDLGRGTKRNMQMLGGMMIPGRTGGGNGRGNHWDSLEQVASALASETPAGGWQVGQALLKYEEIRACSQAEVVARDMETKAQTNLAGLRNAGISRTLLTGAIEMLAVAKQGVVAAKKKADRDRGVECAPFTGGKPPSL